MHQKKMFNLSSTDIKKMKISEFCSINRGRVISKSELEGQKGEFPVYSSQTLNNGVFGKIRTYDFDGEYVQWTTDGANAGSIFYRNGKFSVTNVCGLIKVKEKYETEINMRYLSYYLDKVAKKYVNYSTSNPKLMSNKMAEISVLIPPYQIQTEIVKYLEKFEKYVYEINEELDLRKQQYDYYLNLIFERTEAKRKLLGNCIKLINGKAFKQEELLSSGKYKVIRVGNFGTNDMYYYSDLELDDDKYIDKGDLIYLWSATFGPQIWNKEKAIYHYHIWKLDFDKKEFRKKFLYYFLDYDKNKLKNLTTNSTMPHISMNNMVKRTIPVLSLEEQDKVIDKLNVFTNSIIKLKEEVDLRKQQYNYYKELLLGFEELNVNE